MNLRRGWWLLLPALAYLPRLDMPFALDDRVYVVESPFTHDPGNLWKSFVPSAYFAAGLPEGARYRPLHRALEVTLTTLAGLHPFWHRLPGLLLHLLCGWLVARLALGFGATERAAAIAGFLFLAHPVHSEVVFCSDYRSAQQAGAGILGAWWLFLEGRVGWGAAAYGLALLTREAAVITPVLVAATVRSAAAGPPLRWASWTAALILPTAAYLGLRTRLVPGGLDLAGMMRVDWREAAAAVPEIVRLIVWPWRLAVEYVFPPIRGTGDPRVLAGVAILIVWVGLLPFLWRRSRLAAGLWLGAGLSWAASAPPIPDAGWFRLVMERAFYLPLACLAILGALGLSAVERRRPRAARMLAAGLFVAGLAGAGRAFLRGADWADARRLYLDTLQQYPNAFAARFYLAQHELRERRYAEAAEQFRRVLDLPVPSRLAMSAWADLGVSLKELGRLEEAERAYHQALAMAPGEVRVLFNLGNLARARGRRAEARRWYEQAVAADPAFAPPLLMLGKLAYEAGRPAEAEAWFQRYRSAPRGR